MRPAEVFIVLRDRSIAAVVLAEVASSLGTEMTWLAIPWFVLASTGSPARMGLVFAAEAAPTALLGIPGGAVVQRFGARRTMLASDLARAPLLALFPILYKAGALSYPLLLGLVALAGSFTAPYLSSQRLILPEIVGEDEVLVGKANSLVEGATSLTALIGPAVAGLLIASVGATNVLWFDSASYLISFVLVFGLVATRGQIPEAGKEGSRGALAGVAYIVRDRLLRTMTAAVVLTGLWVSMLIASLPVLAYDRFGQDPRVAGWLFAALGAGLLIGSFLAYKAAARYPPLRTASVAIALLAGPLWILAIKLPAVAVGAVLAITALFAPAVSASVFSYLTLEVQSSFRAKVTTAVLTANLLAAPAGYAIAGPWIQAFGLSTIYLAIASGASLGAVVFAVVARQPRASRAQPRDVSRSR